MNFLMDGVLGKLARWLRILGQDVVYSVEFSDYEFIGLAEKSGRVLLTRDFELYKRAITKHLNAYYVEGETELARLTEVVNRYDLKLVVDMKKSFCPLCNNRLESAPKEQLLDKLNTNTLVFYSEFWSCPNCGQIYWKGSHWKKISATLNIVKLTVERLKEKR